MPPHSLQGAHSLHRETHHHLSLFDGSASNPRKGMHSYSLHSDQSLHSTQSLHCENDDHFSHESPSRPRKDIEDIPLDTTTKTATTVDDEDAQTLDEEVETTKPNDEQDPRLSWFDSILDCLPCTNNRVTGPVSSSTEERHCCECGNKLTNDYHMEIQVRTVVDEETGAPSKVEEILYFAPSCLETRKLRNHHREIGYRLVLDELHAFFEIKRQRTKELFLQARAEQRGKAKARAQASAKQVRASRVEAQAHATFARKRQEAERSSALLKMASLAQESAKVVRQRQEAERQRQQAARSAVLSQYETDLAHRLAKARADAWAKSADFAASDKEQAESAFRKLNESRLNSGETFQTSPKTPRSKIAKRAKKAVKKIACFSHSKKADETGTWEATVDSASGKTYYYNTTTLERTWRKPQHSHSLVLQKQKRRVSF